MSNPTPNRKLKRKRHVCDLTQQELADRAHCGRSSISRIETGDRRPSRRLAAIIAGALDTPVEELFPGLRRPLR